MAAFLSCSKSVSGLLRLGVGEACLAGPLLAPHSAQKRWRRHPKGGRYRPTFHRFPTEVKVDYPPKDRSQLFLLPDSRRLMFVTIGWHYPNGETGPANKRVTPVLSFASRNKQNHMESYTLEEVKKFKELIPTLEKQFAEVEGELKELQKLDESFKHECR
mmetsp:Transcript_6013/g.8571  ORF Transcript_6013/g.8571 Transcript_6013/m.8571 type:complete len:160 (-) Transcript_6013:205-684(-)